MLNICFFSWVQYVRVEIRIHEFLVENKYHNQSNYFQVDSVGYSLHTNKDAFWSFKINETHSWQMRCQIPWKISFVCFVEAFATILFARFCIMTYRFALFHYSLRNLRKWRSPDFISLAFSWSIMPMTIFHEQFFAYMVRTIIIKRVVSNGAAFHRCVDYFNRCIDIYINIFICPWVWYRYMGELIVFLYRKIIDEVLELLTKYC